MTFTAPETTTHYVPQDLPTHIQHYINGEFVDSVGGDDLRRPGPGVQHQLRHRRRRPEGRHRPRRRRRPRGVHQRPVAEDEAPRARPRPEQDRRRRRSPGGPPRRARNLRHRPADHPGQGPGAARGRELPLLRGPDRRPVRRRHEGPRRPDQLRQPQADRRRRASSRRGTRRSCSSPGSSPPRWPPATPWCSSRPSSPRSRPRCGRRSSRTPACPTASSTWSTASARKPATRW